MAVVLIDVGVFHKEAREVRFREAALWTIVWISLGLVFNLLLYQYALWKFAHDPRLLAMPSFDPALAAKQVGLEYLTGFVVEKSLAIDNIFVFVVVFKYFGVPLKYQHRVLFFGILGAVIFRALFVALGSVLMQYHAVVIFFGVFLIFTGLKMLFGPDKPVEPDKNLAIRWLRRFIPISPKFHGQKFFIRENGVLMATPLFVALVVLELTDIVFAVDSVPAIFALTKEPLIVYSSNIFAILGLRAMFFMLSGVMDLFHYLKVGLAVVLVFVGLKMVYLNELFDGKFPIGISLGIIVGIVGLSIAASLLFPKRVGLEE